MKLTPFVTARKLFGFHTNQIRQWNGNDYSITPAHDACHEDYLIA
jgi:hypothetical protein